MEDTNDLLIKMLDKFPHVSDLIISPGRAPQIEVNGELRNLDDDYKALTPNDTTRMATDLIGSRHTLQTLLRDQGACDFSYSFSGRSRFRVNIFMQRGSCALVM